MYRSVFALSLGFVILMFAQTNLAHANNNCAPRSDVINALTTKHGEAQRSLGLGNNNAVYEVFASPQGNWTIVVTTANGTTCLLAAGEAFEQFEATIPSTDAPT